MTPLITYLCKEMGWTVEYVLNMPARRFFAMLIELKEQHRKQSAAFLYDLCDVAAIAICDVKYLKELKGYYKNLQNETWSEPLFNKNPRRVFKADDPKESKAAANVLKAALNGVVLGGR
jgi:hypothetical protein